MDEHVYSLRYSRTPDAWKPSTWPGIVDLAYEVIGAIHGGKAASIPMLQSVLSLSAHPEAFHWLADESLIHDCIHCLARQRKQDPRYPFGCEEGYLYFRIIVLAVGVSIISRHKETFESLIEPLLELAERDDPTPVLMAIIVRASFELMDDRESAIDNLFGWSPDGVPIVTQSDALLILDILWNDRKRFLVAWAYSDSPPLNGLLFVLWRCVHIHSTPDRWVSLCEIFWRYCLVARPEDIDSLHNLNIDAITHYEAWLPRATTVGLADAREILFVCTERLTPGTLIYRPPGLPTLVNMSVFATPSRAGLRLGTEDLFVPLLRALFNHFWTCMATNSPDSTYVLRAADISSILNPVSTLLDHVIDHRLRVGELLHVLAELGIIEAMARGFVLFGSAPSVDTDGQVSPLIINCRDLSYKLYHMKPSSYREAYAGSFVEWWKTLRYLRSRSSFSKSPTHNPYPTEEQSWLELGEQLGYDVQVERAEALTRGCAYTRCPDPDSGGSTHFECRCGKGIVYCGIRCYQADWVTNHLPASHRHTCAWGK